MAVVSLASYECRPVPAGPSMESLIAAARARRAAQADEEQAATLAPTRAMRAAALASDAREAFPHFHDDEEGDRLHRCAGAGYVDATLARD